ncbi:MAG: hypothetical protein ABI234_08820 [Ktedonobacteraceae bacterium]
MSFNTRLLQRCAVLSITCLCLLMSFSKASSIHTVFASTHAQNTTNGNVPVLTYKYDNQRTGENTNETHLNVANVNSKQFGRLISYPVDGQIYAQPLYVPNVKIGSATRNLVFVVTERDSAYAFDADRTSTEIAPIWQTSFLDGGATPISARDINCTNVTPILGVTSTPVIDSATNTLFLVSYATENNAFIYKLHALDLATGHEKSGSPISVHRTSFNSSTERQRAGLLLANGRIYLAFGSFCDHTTYHGWILSYSYNRSGFHPRNSYNDTPTGREGGIWSGGSAIAADQSGNIYAMTGNGTFNLNQGGLDAGDSFLKFDPNLRMVDYFTPFNQSCLAAKDQDLGSGGPLITPGDWLIGGGKQGHMYVMNTHNLGHFHAVANPCGQQGATNLNHIQQELVLNPMRAIFSTPVYWHGSHGDYVFVAGVKTHTQAFTFSQGHLSGPISATPEIFDYSGGNPVVSSDGSTPDTGILWTIVAPGFLRAYDATDLSHELYSNNFGAYNIFVPPVVTNGKVFVATQDSLKIYGLLTSTPPAPPTPEPQLTPPNQPAQPTPTAPPDQSLQTDRANTWAKGKP